MPPSVHIKNLHAAIEGAVSRVCADVNGETLWFESGDLKLIASPEAFCSAMLPAAYFHEADLVVDAEVDDVWSSNIKDLQEVWCRWWGGRKAEVCSPDEQKQVASIAQGKALCFSGGVDSFYTLLRGPFDFDCIVFVHGYDIKLSDRRRAAAAEASLREIASALGIQAVTIRTNLREHPVFATADWEKTHGGALAAIGHLLRHTVGELVISASYPYCYDNPWGSHWNTDPLWSSSILKIVHFGADYWRAEKLRAIAGEDLVRRHLRVCWMNLSEQANCCRCEKCIRTMLVLAGVGQLSDFPVFGGGTGFVESIRNLPPLPGKLVKVYKDFPRDKMSPDVVKALDNLILWSRVAVFGRLLRMHRLARRFSRVFHMFGKKQGAVQ